MWCYWWCYRLVWSWEWMLLQHYIVQYWELQKYILYKMSHLHFSSSPRLVSIVWLFLVGWWHDLIEDYDLDNSENNSKNKFSSYLSVLHHHAFTLLCQKISADILRVALPRRIKYINQTVVIIGIGIGWIGFGFYYFQDGIRRSLIISG